MAFSKKFKILALRLVIEGKQWGMFIHHRTLVVIKVRGNKVSSKWCEVSSGVNFKYATMWYGPNRTK